jgi:hypothetical protein
VEIDLDKHRIYVEVSGESTVWSKKSLSSSDEVLEKNNGYWDFFLKLQPISVLLKLRWSNCIPLFLSGNCHGMLFLIL